MERRREEGEREREDEEVVEGQRQKKSWEEVLKAWGRERRRVCVSEGERERLASEDSAGKYESVKEREEEEEQR